LLVKASLPGFEPEDIDVHVNEGVLSIKAQHSEEHEEQGELATCCGDTSAVRRADRG